MTEKIAILSLFQGGVATEKRPKTALFSLYLLYEKIQVEHSSPVDAHDFLQCRTTCCMSLLSWNSETTVVIAKSSCRYSRSPFRLVLQTSGVERRVTSSENTIDRKRIFANPSSKSQYICFGLTK